MHDAYMTGNHDAAARRLQEARAEAGFGNASEAARALGVREPTYLGHENASRGFKAEASRYADFFKVNLEWLLLGRGPKKRTPSGERLPGEKPVEIKKSQASETILPPNAVYIGEQWPRDLRVLGLAECGPDGWSLLNGEVIEMTSRPPSLAGAKLAYAVYVVGDSMEPRYFAGELAYVHPGKPISIGDFVLVQVHGADGDDAPKAIIKRLVKRSPTRIVLEQYNPAKTTELKATEVKSVHLVVGSGRL